MAIQAGYKLLVLPGILLPCGMLRGVRNFMIEITRTYRAVKDAFHFARIIADEKQIQDVTRFLMLHSVIERSDFEFANKALEEIQHKNFVYADTDSIFLEPQKD